MQQALVLITTDEEKRISEICIKLNNFYKERYEKLNEILMDSSEPSDDVNQYKNIIKKAFTGYLIGIDKASNIPAIKHVLSLSIIHTAHIVLLFNNKTYKPIEDEIKIIVSESILNEYNMIKLLFDRNNNDIKNDVAGIKSKFANFNEIHNNFMENIKTIDEVISYTVILILFLIDFAECQ